MFDITPYLRPGDPFLQTAPLENIRRGYEFKHHLAGVLAPRSIVEIGVRAGYSAAAFLAACPTAKFVGLDADNGRDGGERGYSTWAEKMLREKFPAAEIGVLRCDTQAEAWWDIFEALKPVDLVHVDGDHSFDGCLRDLENAAKVGRWILVDDLDFIPDVRRAVASFLFHTPYEHVQLESFRGDCLIRVR